MRRHASDLEPGDIIHVQGQRVMVESVTVDGDICNIHHSGGVKFCRSDARVYIEDGSDYVSEAEQIIRSRR